MKRFFLMALAMCLMGIMNSVWGQNIKIGGASASPSAPCVGDAVTITVEITNNTGYNINGWTNYHIQYRWNNSGAWTDAVNIGQNSGNFPSGSTQTFTFTVLPSAAGNQTLNIRTFDSNFSDELDAFPLTIDVSCNNNPDPGGDPDPGGGNPPATTGPPADDCENAPLINTNDTYTGNTGDYSSDSPNWLDNIGELHDITIENSSYYKFIASGTGTVDFKLCVDASSCTRSWAKGIQAYLFHGNCGDPSSLQTVFFTKTLGQGTPSTVDVPSGSSSYSGDCLTVTVTGLTVGEVYYFMVDGYEGDNCDFSIEFTGGISVLPVELAYFKGYSEGDYNIFNWKTVSEKNNARFIVERSTNARVWEEVNTQLGAGNSTVSQFYTFRDNNYPKRINYYRLLQVNYNGNLTYYDIISIDNRGERELIKQVNILGQEVDKDYRGIVIKYYNDNSHEKVLQR